MPVFLGDIPDCDPKAPAETMPRENVCGMLQSLANHDTVTLPPGQRSAKSGDTVCDISCEGDLVRLSLNQGREKRACIFHAGEHLAFVQGARGVLVEIFIENSPRAIIKEAACGNIEIRTAFDTGEPLPELREAMIAVRAGRDL